MNTEEPLPIENKGQIYVFLEVLLKEKRHVQLIKYFMDDSEHKTKERISANFNDQEISVWNSGYRNIYDYISAIQASQTTLVKDMYYFKDLGFIEITPVRAKRGKKDFVDWYKPNRENLNIFFQTILPLAKEWYNNIGKTFYSEEIRNTHEELKAVKRSFEEIEEISRDEKEEPIDTVYSFEKLLEIIRDDYINSATRPPKDEKDFQHMLYSFLLTDIKKDLLEEVVFSGEGEEYRADFYYSPTKIIVETKMAYKPHRTRAIILKEVKKAIRVSMENQEKVKYMLFVVYNQKNTIQNIPYFKKSVEKQSTDIKIEVIVLHGG